MEERSWILFYGLRLACEAVPTECGVTRGNRTAMNNGFRSILKAEQAKVDQQQSAAVQFAPEKRLRRRLCFFLPPSKNILRSGMLCPVARHAFLLDCFSFLETVCHFVLDCV